MRKDIEGGRGTNLEPTSSEVVGVDSVVSGASVDRPHLGHFLTGDDWDAIEGLGLTGTVFKSLYTGRESQADIATLLRLIKERISWRRIGLYAPGKTVEERERDLKEIQHLREIRESVKCFASVAQKEVC